MPRRVIDEAMPCSAAAEWWAKAAGRGDADAQAMLGAAFHLGAGVPQDRVAAFALLLRARKGGSALASSFFDAVRGTLSSHEMAEAEARAAAPLERDPEKWTPVFGERSCSTKEAGAP